jgi:hypothetical protein
MTKNGLALLVSAITLTLGLQIGEAPASCGDRPGTPDQVTATPLPITPSRSTPSIKLEWRNTTRRGVFAVPGGYFDIEVTDRAGRNAGLGITGGAFQGNDYGTRGSHVFHRLSPNTTLCFRVKARTEGGTQGCVSQLWSERVCATIGAIQNNNWIAVAGDEKGHWAWGLGKNTAAAAEEVATSNCNFGCRILFKGQANCFAIAESKPAGRPWAVASGHTLGAAQIEAQRICAAKAPGTCHGVKALCSH